jgi:uncharacterized protein HemX
MRRHFARLGFFFWTLCNRMLPSTPYPEKSTTRAGPQPIAFAAVIFVVLMIGVAGIALWRAYGGQSPELDRAAIARQLQAARTAQVSEQLAEKTKGLEATQQQSIDQLQMVQDQLQTMKSLLASQQADNKKLADQVAALNEAVDGLRQSFASSQASEPSPSPATRNRSIRTRAHAVRTVHRAKSRT